MANILGLVLPIVVLEHSVRPVSLPDAVRYIATEELGIFASVCVVRIDCYIIGPTSRLGTRFSIGAAKRRSVSSLFGSSQFTNELIDKM